MSQCSECNANALGEPLHYPTCSKFKPYTIESILANRGKEYGPFISHADITQQLKSVMQETDNWGGLQSDQKESLEMIAHKIGRILNGNPNNQDSWADIAGYAKLIADRLQGIVV